jgi:uncharacterized protein
MKWLLLFLLTFSVLFAPYPQYQGYVSDYAGVLSSEYRASLEQNISDFENRTSNEIAVVIIPELGDANDSNVSTDLNTYATQLFNTWGIGKKEKNNGILLLISMNDRMLRIAVGYGLESVVTNATAKRIIEEDLLPYFAKSEYEHGISNGVNSIMKTIDSVNATTKPSDVKPIVGQSNKTENRSAETKPTINKPADNTVPVSNSFSPFLYVVLFAVIIVILVFVLKFSKLGHL